MSERLALTRSSFPSGGSRRLAPALAAAVSVVTVLAAGAAMIPADNPRTRAADAPLAPAGLELASIALRFLDRADGGVIVIDVASGLPLDEFAPGTNDFVRGVLRALARGRAAQGIGSEPEFRLSREPRGHLMLLDTATGQQVALDAFGQTNAAVFARLLAAGQVAHREGFK